MTKKQKWVMLLGLYLLIIIANLLSNLIIGRYTSITFIDALNDSIGITIILVSLVTLLVVFLEKTISKKL